MRRFSVCFRKVTQGVYTQRNALADKSTPGVRPWNLKNLYDELNKRKKTRPGARTLFPGGSGDTLYVEMVRFRPVVSSP